jgi:hypothetical protein
VQAAKEIRAQPAQQGKWVLLVLLGLVEQQAELVLRVLLVFVAPLVLLVQQEQRVM